MNFFTFCEYWKIHTTDDGLIVNGIIGYIASTFSLPIDTVIVTLIIGIRDEEFIITLFWMSHDFISL